MSRLAAVLALLLCCAWNAAAASPTELWVWRGARLTSLVAPADVAALKLRLGAEFEIPARGRVVALTSAGELVDLTARRLLPAASPLGITSFTSDGHLLIALRGRRLGWYDGKAVAEKLQLPQDGLRVAAGAKQRLYLYGPQGAGSVVYLLERGRVGKLLEVADGRIAALAAIGERLFFAVGNTIYTAAEGQRPAIVFVASGGEAIRSVAPDPRSGLLYFSAGDTVYAARAGMGISVLRGLEGVLRCTGDGLYVLDPWQGALVRLAGLERLLEIGAGPEPPGAAAPPTVPLKE